MMAQEATVADDPTIPTPMPMGSTNLLSTLVMQERETKRDREASLCKSAKGKGGKEGKDSKGGNRLAEARASQQHERRGKVRPIERSWSHKATRAMDKLSGALQGTMTFEDLADQNSDANSQASEVEEQSEYEDVEEEEEEGAAVGEEEGDEYEAIEDEEEEEVQDLQADDAEEDDDIEEEELPPSPEVRRQSRRSSKGRDAPSEQEPSASSRSKSGRHKGSGSHTRTGGGRAHGSR